MSTQESPLSPKIPSPYLRWLRGFSLGRPLALILLALTGVSPICSSSIWLLSDHKRSPRCQDVFSPPPLLLQGLPNSLLTHLLNFHYSAENNSVVDRVMPSDRSAWFAYKNGPNLTPRTIDLSDPSWNRPWKIPPLLYLKAKAPHDPILYDQVLISLRQGDTVRVKSHVVTPEVGGERQEYIEYKLGPYLGKALDLGPTVFFHFFALEDYPDHTLGIPFLPAEFIDSESLDLRGLSGSYYQQIFELSRKAYPLLQQREQEVFAGPEFRYLRLPRVHFQMKALDLLQKILGRNPSSHLNSQTLIQTFGTQKVIFLEKLSPHFSSQTKDLFIRLIEKVIEVYGPDMAEIYPGDPGEGPPSILLLKINNRLRRIVLSNDQWEVLDWDPAP